MMSSTRVAAHAAQHTFWRVAILVLTCLVALSGRALAQNGTATPTDAPTKTPLAPTATAETTEAVETTATDDFGLISLTQANLSILTGNVQRPNGMVWHDGHLYVSCSGDWTLYRLDDTTGQTAAYIYGVRNTHAMHAETAEDGELHLWVPDFQSNTFLHITRMGVTTIVSDLSGPWGVTGLGDSSFLVTNIHSNSVSRLTRNGERQDIIAGLAAPTGITHDDDYIYVANNGSTRRAIEWYELTGFDNANPVATPAPDETSHTLVRGLQNVTGLTFGPDGKLYFAYSLGNRGVVGRVDPQECRENGGCTGDQVEIVILTDLAAPLAGLTVSPENRIYIHTMFSPDIYWAQLPTGESNLET